jgi:type I restriction enzyme R subunit
VIADEAHSSQSGSTARQLKEVLMTEETDDDVEMSSEDILDATVAARKGNNLNYYAFRHAESQNPGAVWPSS